MDIPATTLRTELPGWIPEGVRSCAMHGKWTEPGPPFLIDQNRILLFANATKDFQGIHVDKDVAAERGFSDTVVHGILVLGLIPYLSPLYRELLGARLSVVPHRLNSTVFVQPVLAGAQVRGLTKIDTCCGRDKCCDFDITSRVQQKVGEVWKTAVSASMSIKVFPPGR